MTPDHMLKDADALLAEGDYEGALTLAAAAHAAAEVAGTSVARSARATAIAHQCLGNLEAAGRYAAAAIEAFDAEGKHDSPQLAEALHVRAVVHLDAGDLETATPLLERAATILEGQGAHHDLCAVLLTLGEVSLAVGSPDDAQGLFKRILDTVEGARAESEGHASQLNGLLAKAFLGLGAVAVQRDDALEAKDMLSRAQEFVEAGFGVAHPETVAALHEVASLYRILGDDEAAAAADEERSVAERMLAEVEAATAHPSN